MHRKRGVSVSLSDPYLLRGRWTDLDQTWQPGVNYGEEGVKVPPRPSSTMAQAQ